MIIFRLKDPSPDYVNSLLLSTIPHIKDSVDKGSIVVIDLNLSKPLRTTLAELIVCLLENDKAHNSKLGETLSINGTGTMTCIHVNGDSYSRSKKRFDQSNPFISSIALLIRFKNFSTSSTIDSASSFEIS